MGCANQLPETEWERPIPAAEAFLANCWFASLLSGGEPPIDTDELSPGVLLVLQRQYSSTSPHDTISRMADIVIWNMRFDAFINHYSYHNIGLTGITQ